MDKINNTNSKVDLQVWFFTIYPIIIIYISYLDFVDIISHPISQIIEIRYLEPQKTSPCCMKFLLSVTLLIVNRSYLKWIFQVWWGTFNLNYKKN